MCSTRQACLSVRQAHQMTQLQARGMVVRGQQMGQCVHVLSRLAVHLASQQQALRCLRLQIKIGRGSAVVKVQ